MSKNLKYLIRSVFFLAVLVNAFSLPKMCHAANRSLWQKRQKNIQNVVNTQIPAKKTFRKLIDPLKIKIPDEYGTVIESHRGSNGRLIVHVQDAHANYEGQMNLANILESLIKEHELKLILVEGGSTDADFSYLRNWTSLEKRKVEAEKLLRKGIITGEEYLNIASDYPMFFQGIEDRAIYDANVDALWEIDKFKPSSLEYVSTMTKIADILKPKIYNEDLLEIDNKRNAYDNKEIDLLSYYIYLYEKYKELGKADIVSQRFPNFSNLIKLNKLEKKLDLAKIKEGKATTEEIKLYKDYVEATQNLDINKLFKEEPRLEDLLKDSLSTNPDQKTLLKISKDLSIMKNLLNIKVVPEEYEYFLENRKDFDPEFWADFLKEKSDSFKLSLKIPENKNVIADNLGKIEEFYGIAEKRDHVFLKKTEECFKEYDSVKTVALITGGFHTPRLTELLADKGYSYIVISPKVTQETDEEFYRTTLRREWFPER